MTTGVKKARRYNSPLREEQAGLTRRRALAAARDLFLAHGYAGTTVAEVAKAAGLSPDTIYVSLGGKQGLLEGVWAQAVYDPEDSLQREQERRLERIAGLSDPHQRLRQLVKVSCETLARTRSSTSSTPSPESALLSCWLAGASWKTCSNAERSATVSRINDRLRSLGSTSTTARSSVGVTRRCW